MTAPLHQACARAANDSDAPRYLVLQAFSRRCWQAVATAHATAEAAERAMRAQGRRALGPQP